MHGHSASDDASYVPAGLLAEWKEKDPISRFEKHLLSRNVLTPETIAREDENIHRAVEEAAHEALQRPYPPAGEAALGVYAAPGEGGWPR
jgi:TPP-dependent pyruvate/acetoin dehydrogenase alpha subunit